jgi:hypothetical protein
MVLKAIAVADDEEASEIVQYTYTFAGQAAAPVMSIPSGQVEQGERIELTTATEDAVIYYSTNGADPTEDSTLYAGAITLMRPVTIKAIAVKKGLHDSVVNSATYTVTEPEPITEETGDQELPKVTQTDRLTSRRTYSDSTIGPSFTDVIITNPEYNAVLASEKEIVEPDAKLVMKQIDYSDADQQALSRCWLQHRFPLRHQPGTRRRERAALGRNRAGHSHSGRLSERHCRGLPHQRRRIGRRLPHRRSGQMAYVLVDHFSKYAITVPETVRQSAGSIGLWLAAGGAAGVALLGLIALIVMSVRKKKKQKS